ncbi:DUF1467 family protein [Temperatibacter marinus]|uniref:DUF1467 family protein n=1 Tax=Temperatibacter marinus TaxID=1456591 RepID=A0AA52EEY4_9PROT|nr:DUF1467 family protein [Temperatibacter marinus]WND02398.1 DUF1467 family protein [Temperatibacter marinus]
MALITKILVYVVIWWVVFLPVLSIGVQNQAEAKDERVAGTDPGAPANASLKKKIIITSVTAFFLTALFVYLEGIGFIQVRPE